MTTEDFTQMKEIHGNARSVKEILKGNKYQIDYYQREYKWKREQVEELIDDLTGCFLQDHSDDDPRGAVAQYKPYFLGSIVVSKKGTSKFIVDGQQRMTTLTLLFIFLAQLQKGREDQVSVDDLIFSSMYGSKSYNIEAPDYPERQQALDAIYQEVEPIDRSDLETAQNLFARFDDISSYFPEEIKDGSLPYFIDWLLEKVVMVEITAYNDDDAYTIFETMNDRGLMLSPVDMLKGYLLASIRDENKRNKAADVWREIMADVAGNNAEQSAEFIKAWLRSQYAESIRERTKNAKAQDYDRLGTEFHRWIRDNAKNLQLDKSDVVYEFITRKMLFYAKVFKDLRTYAKKYTDPYQDLFHLDQYGFTLHPMLILATLKVEDTPEVIQRKIRLVNAFVEIWLTRRLWNYNSISSSTLHYRVFQLLKEIRGQSVEVVREKLLAFLAPSNDFAAQPDFLLNKMNRYMIHRILARMTDYLDIAAGIGSNYTKYVAEGKERFEVEHIWADHFERHTDEFDHAVDFGNHRNRIGGLLLLPKKFNASFGDLPYADKYPLYYGQNYLAKSLNEKAYTHESAFTSFRQRSGLPFKPMSQFNKADLEERQQLYIELASMVWSLERLNV